VLATLAQSLSVAVAVVLCGVVFRGRSRDPMALLFTLTMLLFSAFGSRTLLTYGDVPVLRHAFTVAGWGTFVCLALVFVLFPDGRVVPRWGRWLPPGMVGLLVVFPDAISLADRLVQGATDTSPRTYVALLGVGAVLTLGAVAQVHRYRYVSSTVERQQAKWVTGPLAVLLTFVLVGITVPLVLPGTGERWLGWMLVAVLFHRLRSRVRKRSIAGSTVPATRPSAPSTRSCTSSATSSTSRQSAGASSAPPRSWCSWPAVPCGS
jgi:hypothetical protein